MVQMRDFEIVEAFHEPERLLSPALSSILDGGEGARRAGEEEFQFMASIHVQFSEVFPPHEPPEKFLQWLRQLSRPLWSCRNRSDIFRSHW